MKKSLINDMFTLMLMCSSSQRRMKSRAVRLTVSISCPSSTSHTKANVPVLYTHVYYRLRQERQHELQQATQGKPHGYLPEVLSVFLQVAEQEAERTAFAAVA